jgi:hypothetical protein
MDQRLQDVLRWFRRRAKTLDLLPEFVGAVYSRWNDYLWGELPVAPVVIWWIFGNPPMWVTVPVFLWAFLIACYYVWRKERLRNVSDNFRCSIYAAASESSRNVNSSNAALARLFVGLRIVNVGPQTSIHTWQIHYRNKGRGRGLAHGLLYGGETAPPSPDIRGHNLRDDIRLLATGETREGWIAFDIGNDDFSEIMQSISVGFTDAFDSFHEITHLSGWRVE